MTSKKHSVNELFEMLIAACVAQFAFNPKQVSAGMRYMGLASRGVHLFRDTGTHSQILLRLATREATLVKSNFDQEYWSDSEIAFYRKTDAELAADRQREKDRLTTVKESTFFLQHAAYLRSLFRGHPAYKEKNPTPYDGAIALVQSALTNGDVEAEALAIALSTRDVNKLGNWLLDPISEEHSQETERLIRQNSRYPEALAAMKELYGLSKDAPAKTVKAAQSKLHQLVTEIQTTTKGSVSASQVSYALVCDLTKDE